MVERIPSELDSNGDRVGEEVAELVHAVNRRLREAAHRDLGPLGVTPAQLRALRAVARDGDPIRMGDVADRLRIARRSATSVIDELVERGLVRRRDDADDRRAVVVEATVAGRDLLDALAASRRAATADLVSSLPRTDLIALRDLLRLLAPDESS